MKLSIVGTGPGDHAYLPPRAQHVLQQAEEIVGYGLYLDLLGPLTTGKTCHALGLGDETERARLALQRAATGKHVALVSSGDAGIFAMATLVFELLDQQPQREWEEIDIEVIPGITAMQMAASRVGAPLAHDFCAISLSDLLTPWQVIEKRIRAAAEGDFVISFYNPVSRKRDWQLARAKEILLNHRCAVTPVVIARQLGRAEEDITLTTLADLQPDKVDMLSVVVIGNTETRRIKDWIYTPRGYAGKAGR